MFREPDSAGRVQLGKPARYFVRAHSILLNYNNARSRNEKTCVQHNSTVEYPSTSYLQLINTFVCAHAYPAVIFLFGYSTLINYFSYCSTRTRCRRVTRRFRTLKKQKKTLQKPCLCGRSAGRRDRLAYALFETIPGVKGTPYRQ